MRMLPSVSPYKNEQRIYHGAWIAKSLLAALPPATYTHTFTDNRSPTISFDQTTAQPAELDQHLPAHIAHLENHWSQALEQHQFDGAWLVAGEAIFDFQDDHGPRFKPNPYLAQWVAPEFISPGSRLLLQPGHKPVLFLHQPTDYWHAHSPLPQQIAPYVDIRPFAETAELLQACQQHMQADKKMAVIGPEGASNEQFGEPNPAELTAYLHFHRAHKTSYELAVMRTASDIGAAGHVAAEACFHSGGSEFDIHMAYLVGSQQSEVELPYGNIVALNEHGSVLHYQFQDRTVPNPSRSLLIDAGGNYRGYASDITRTYTAQGSTHQRFRDLISAMQDHQLALIDKVAPGVTFADLHVQMHRQLAQVLADAELVNCSPEQAFEESITEDFCPHGLGHLLGLQVHDVGGHLADDQGNSAPPPEQYPTLRFTRAVELDHVFTIEPGLYFIASLLADARNHNTKRKLINWDAVEALKGYGGIRIEDNVRVLADGVENLTRNAFRNIQK
ncbi:MAG: Xaa-Pro dipeptidase [Pseudomonadaceae bacterium]|nr:Xaa-Pro dipeptidase [Pseudomonadaceae bacterium]